MDPIKIVKHNDIEQACINGDLIFIKNKSNQFPLYHKDFLYAIDYASEFNHLPIVQWLLANRSEGCTINAFDQASSNGHFEIVQLLYQYNKSCTYNAFILAIKNNHTQISKWIFSTQEN